MQILAKFVKLLLDLIIQALHVLDVKQIVPLAVQLMELLVIDACLPPEESWYKMVPGFVKVALQTALIVILVEVIVVYVKQDFI